MYPMDKSRGFQQPYPFDTGDIPGWTSRTHYKRTAPPTRRCTPGHIGVRAMQSPLRRVSLLILCQRIASAIRVRVPSARNCVPADGHRLVPLRNDTSIIPRPFLPTAKAGGLLGGF